MNRRPRLLDLYCGAGGASVGYARAGFDVVGVDHVRQPHYPFDFVLYDALAVPLDFVQLFDVVHASPPCQAYSVLGKRWKDRTWPDLVADTREMLVASGRPYVIENVRGAPLHEPVLFCGGGYLPVVTCKDGKQRQVRRHRLFESSVPLMAYPCQHPFESLGVYGRGRWDASAAPGRRGGYQGSAEENAEGMDVSWMNRDELCEAIPPAYTEAIGWQLVAWLDAHGTPAESEVA